MEFCEPFILWEIAYSKAVSMIRWLQKALFISLQYYYLNRYWIKTKPCYIELQRSLLSSKASCDRIDRADWTLSGNNQW